MRKKIISSLLAITVLFSLSACGNNEPDAAALEDSISTEFVTIEQTESSEQTAPTEQAVAKKNEVNKESEPLKNTESNSPTEESKKESVTSESTESSSKDKGTKQSTTTTATEKENKTKDKTNNKPTTTTTDKPSESSKPSESASVSSKPSESTPESNESKPQTKPDSQPSQEPSTPQPQVHTCSFGSGTVTTAATCTNDGMMTYTCSCGATKTETIPATGHKMTTDTTPATCTAAGKIKTYCTVCGYVESESSNGAATGHSWGELSWFNPQTCTQGGWWTRSCTVCGEADGGRGEPLGHSWIEEITSENCWAKSIKRTCTTCGFEENEVINKSGCVDNDGDNICDVCGDVM